MSNKRLSLPLIGLILFCVCTAAIAHAAITGCVSGKCHSTMKNKPIHPQEKECQSCHEAISTPHPQPNKKTFSIVNSTCMECHKEVVDFDHLHSPVAAETCNACHDPHSQDNDLPRSGKSPVCYNCHQPVVDAKDTIVHDHIQEGKCERCHTSHGSFYPGLLQAEYSHAFFNDFTQKTYELCFRCHKIDLLLHPKTSYNTNFRDGKKNLHYIHVNRTNKGRSCKFCHAVHAGTEPKLMTTTIAFGDWQMPINFKISKNGGSCAPGCHKPKSYDRTIKVGRTLKK